MIPINDLIKIAPLISVIILQLVSPNLGERIREDLNELEGTLEQKPTIENRMNDIISLINYHKSRIDTLSHLLYVIVIIWTIMSDSILSGPDNIKKAVLIGLLAIMSSIILLIFTFSYYETKSPLELGRLKQDQFLSNLRILIPQTGVLIIIFSNTIVILLILIY